MTLMQILLILNYVRLFTIYHDSIAYTTNINYIYLQYVNLLLLSVQYKSCLENFGKITYEIIKLVVI